MKIKHQHDDAVAMRDCLLTVFCLAYRFFSLCALRLFVWHCHCRLPCSLWLRDVNVCRVALCGSHMIWVPWLLLSCFGVFLLLLFGFYFNVHHPSKCVCVCVCLCAYIYYSWRVHDSKTTTHFFFLFVKTNFILLFLSHSLKCFVNSHSTIN